MLVSEDYAKKVLGEAAALLPGGGGTAVAQAPGTLGGSGCDPRLPDLSSDHLTVLHTGTVSVGLSRLG